MPSNIIKIDELEEDHTDDYTKAVSELRDCISLLFRFEQLTHDDIEHYVIQNMSWPSDTHTVRSSYFNKSGNELDTFRRNVRIWIHQLTAVLLRTATVDDYRFMVFECIRCRHISEWGRALFQVPFQRSDAMVDFFLASLSIFLIPLRLCDSPESGREVKSNLIPSDIILLEEDYKALWEQFPIFEFIDYMLIGCRDNATASRFSSWSDTFAVFDTILYILQQSLKIFNTPSHRQFARQIGNIIVRCLQTTTAILQHNGLLDLHTQQRSDISVLYNTYFLKTFSAILRTPAEELGLWSFLPELPFETVTGVTSAALFWICYTLPRQLPVCFNSFCSFRAWSDLMGADRTLREQFTEMMGNGQHAFHLVPVLSKLAETGTFVLASIILNELFMLGFVATVTRMTYFKQIMPYMTSLVNHHPQLSSMLLRLVVRFISYIDRASISLFKSLALEFWSPSEADIKLITDMLSKSVESSEFQVALICLEGLNYQSILPAVRQKQICLAIIDCITEHRKTSGGFLKSSPILSYNERFWNIILSFKLHTDDGKALFDVEPSTHPALDNVTKNVRSSSHRRNDFDSMSCYILFTISNIGHCLETFSQDQSGLKLLEYMIQCQSVDKCIRIMVELSVRLLDKKDEDRDGSIHPFTLEPLVEAVFESDRGISNFISTTIGRLMSRNRFVMNNTHQLAAAICLLITRLHEHRILQKNTMKTISGNDTNDRNNGVLQAYHLADFWFQELCKVSNWHENDAALFCMNKISETCLRLQIHSPVIVRLIEKPELCQFSLGNTPNFLSSILQRNAYPSNLFSGSLFSRKSMQVAKDYPHLMLLLLLGLAHVQQSKREKIVDIILFQRIPFEKAVKSAGDAHEHAIYRTLAHALTYTRSITKSEGRQDMDELDELHVPLIFFWQLFFTLFFDSKTSSENLNVHYYGYYWLDIESREALIADTIKSLNNLSIYYKSRTETIQSQLRQRDKTNNNVSRSNQAKLHMSISSRPQELHLKWSRMERQTMLFADLSHIYHAMRFWIDQPNLLTLIDRIASSKADSSLLPDRLLSVIRDSVYIRPQMLWFDLADAHDSKLRFEQETQRILQTTMFPKLILSQGPTYRQQLMLLKQNVKINLEQWKESERNSILSAPPIFDNGSPHITAGEASLDIPTITQAGVFYHQSMMRHMQLDDEFMNMLPRKYDNITKVANLELRCIRGPLCDTPAKVSFHYQIAQINQSVQNGIEINRATAASLFNADMNQPALRAMLLEIEITIRHILCTKDSSSGVRWFFLLSGALQMATQGFPPLRTIMESLLHELGNAFICNSASETMNLLGVMLDHVAQIPLLHRHFNPHLCPFEWVKLLESLYECKKRRGATLISQLYRRFDTAKWLQGQIPTDVRKELLEHCSVVILEYDSDASGSVRTSEEEEIYAFYRSSFIAIMQSNFPELHLLGLQMVMDGVLHASLSPSMLQLIADDLPLQLLTHDIFCRQIETITEHLWKIRRSRNSTFYDVRRQYLAGAIALVRQSFIRLPRDFIFGNTGTIFELLCSVFEPWLFTTTSEQFSQQKQTRPSIVMPFELPRHQQDSSMTISALVDIIQHIQAIDPRILQQVWHLYSQILLPNMPTQALHLFQVQFTRIQWRDWTELGFEQVQQMRSIVNNTSDYSTLQFVGVVVMNVQWHSIQTNLEIRATATGTTSTDVLMSEHFYAPLLTLLVHLTLRAPQSQRTQDNLPIFACAIQHISLLNGWKRIQYRDYAAVLNDLNSLMTQSSHIIPSDLEETAFMMPHVHATLVLLCACANDPIDDVHSKEVVAPVADDYNYSYQRHDALQSFNVPVTQHETPMQQRKLLLLVKFVHHIMSFAFTHGEARMSKQNSKRNKKDEQQQPNLPHPQRVIVHFFNAHKENVTKIIMDQFRTVYEQESASDFLIRMEQYNQHHSGGNDIANNDQRGNTYLPQISQSTLEIASQLLQPFNITSKQFEAVALSVLNSIELNPSIALPFMAVCSRTVSAFENLTKISEACLWSHFKVSSSWKIPLALLDLSSLDNSADLVAQCIGNNSLLTLALIYMRRYGIASTRISHSTGHYNALNVAQELEKDLISTIMQIKKPIHGKEHHSYALWILYLSKFDTSTKVLKADYADMSTFITHILEISGHKSSLLSKWLSGLMSSGKGVTAEFAATNRLLACFLLRHVAAWSTNHADAQKEYNSLFSSIQRDHQQSSSSGVNNAHFAAMATTLEFIADNSRSLRDAAQLLRQLIMVFYPSDCLWLPTDDDVNL